MAMQHGLDGDHIRQLVADLAKRLRASNAENRIIIAGGALLAWHGLRESTHDVDSLTYLDGDIQHAIRDVAADHDLAPNWLNHNARPFTPATLESDTCGLLFDERNLVVCGVPLHMLFLMKLDRAAPNDVDDMVTLWPLIEAKFQGIDDIVEQYYAAYPLARFDEFLGRFVEDIARRAGR